jgi:glycosyltransferase involved in cell wall biosynthesis
MVCMFKNEAPYLNEWISFHREFGIEHFYFLDDGSTDNFREILRPWEDLGVVTIVKKKWKNQSMAYQYALIRWGSKTRWMTFNDVDEFLFSPKGRSLPDVLKNYEGESAVFVYWKLFGSGGNIQKPSSSVIESYLYSISEKEIHKDDFDHKKDPSMRDYVTGWAIDGKSIVNPRAIKYIGVHKPASLKYGRVIDESFNPAYSKVKGYTPSFKILRINHYWSKSLEEFDRKLEYRSIANRNRPPKNKIRWLEREKMLNSEFDDTILQALKKLRNGNAV